MTTLARLFLHRDGTVHADMVEDWKGGIPDVPGYEARYGSAYPGEEAFAVYRQDPHPTAREVAETAEAWATDDLTTSYALKVIVRAWVEGGRR